MKRLASLIVLGVCAWPSLASAPVRATKSKPKPRIVHPNQVPGQPAMRIPPTIPMPLLSSRLLEAVVCPDRAFTKLILDQLSTRDAISRMNRLLAESNNL